MCVCVCCEMIRDIQSDGGCCPCNVSVDIHCCYCCWLQSDPALLPPDSQTAELLPSTLAHSPFLSVSVSSCLSLLPSLSLFVPMYSPPVLGVASVKNDHEIGPSGS